MCHGQSKKLITQQANCLIFDCWLMQKFENRKIELKSHWHVIRNASACILRSLDIGISSPMVYLDHIVLLSKRFLLSYSEINVGYGHAMSCIFRNVLTVFRHIALPFFPISTLPSYKLLSCVIMRDTEDKWVLMHEWSC